MPPGLSLTQATEVGTVYTPELPGVSLRYPRQVNGVFVDLPEPVQAALRHKGWQFYNFIGGSSRLMCSWSTREAQVDRFLEDVRSLLNNLDT